MAFFKVYRGMPLAVTSAPGVMTFGPYATHEQAMREPGPREGFMPLEARVIEATDVEEAGRMALEVFGLRAPDGP